MTKVFVISRDRLDPILKLLPWIEHHEVHIVDNASTYPPLVEFLNKTDHIVHRLRGNHNHRAPWIAGLVPKNERYIVTDPDVVPDDQCPMHYANVMSLILDADPILQKVGFGLRIDDIPDHYAGKDQVMKWETPLWGMREDIEGYQCHRVPIDTTFALYREGTHVGKFESPSDMHAIRLGPPFVARHLPWYQDSNNPSEEDVYYKEHANAGVANWTYTGASKSHGG